MYFTSVKEIGVCVFFFLFSKDEREQPPIRRLSEFVSVIQDIEKNKTEKIVYRGHGDAAWIIQPSLFRNMRTYSAENSILRTLLASQPESFSDDKSMLDRLVRMQHFSLPTRLLDVSLNPLVALYFCVNSNRDRDGHVVLIGYNKDDDKFFDSDTVSCITNLAYMKSSERNVIRRNSHLDIVEFNILPAVRRLSNFIKSEKPYFETIINPFDLSRNILVRPKLTNKRIVAQNGVFILFGLKHKPLELNPGNFTIKRLLIKSGDKERIANELDLFGFNDASMFPELESASKYIAKKFS